MIALLLREINLLEDKMNKKLLLFVVGVFIISSVCALGVSPGRTTVEFEPGLSRTVSFSVINSGTQDMNVVLAAQGDLSEYISLSSGAISVLAAENKPLSYTISLPNSLEPGLHTGEIFIVEVPKSSDSESSAVLATLAVVTQLHINVPYPGKFAEADLVIYDAKQGEEVQFVFPILSQGKFDLMDVKANVDIYNSLGEKVDSFNTQSISVPGGTRKEIVYNWKADFPIGNYRAVASVIYDEGTIPLETTFSIGSKELELQEISVNDFSLGEIVKLEMLVENKWSEKINGAHIETRIKNDKGDVVSSFDSAKYDIDALAKQTFVSYWDTAGVIAGDYQTEVAIKYDDKGSVMNLEFQVSKNDLKVLGLGYVISADGGNRSNTLITVLVVVIVLLVLINLLWFFLLSKRLKK